MQVINATLAVFLFVTFVCDHAALAQIVDVQREARSVLRDDLLKIARSSDQTVRFRTSRTPSGRVDLEAGVARAVYRVSGSVAAASAHETALTLLRSRSAEFGWSSAAADLRLLEVRDTGVSQHVLFEQTYRGLPVHRRYVKVNLGRGGLPESVLSGYAPGLDRADLSITPSVGAESVRSIVRDLSLLPVASSEPVLVVVPGPSPRLAWRIKFRPDGRPGEWEALIDAHTGEEIQILSVSISRRSPSVPGGIQPAVSAASSSLQSVQSTGSGLVFDPDPLSTADVIYGSPYVDDGDASSSFLAAEQLVVDLHGISQGPDDLYRLEGPFVRIVTSNQDQRPTPAEPSPHDFHYQRSDPGFEAVMSYFHVDRSQRYVQSLGFSGIRSDGVAVDPRASSQDNSYYIPSQNLIQFGTGGVDDAEDAGVIWHEYAHALLESSARDLIASAEGRALHEGWADYWAASYMRWIYETGQAPRADWENLFHWDSGDGRIWSGRSVGGIPGRRYPEDVYCDDVDAGTAPTCDIYADGRLWSTTLMEIHDGLGRDVTDRLSLQSHAYLSFPATFLDAGEALIEADRDLFQSIHTEYLIETLGARGLVDKAPAIAHEPLRSSEQTGGQVAVVADVYEVGDPIQSVRLWHRKDNGSYESLSMALSTGSTYEADLPLPNAFASISYYIEALDEGGRLARLPRGAPDEVFSFRVGPDTSPPKVEHEPVTSASPVLWPIPVTASASDDLGVNHVRVEYEVLDAQRAVVSSATFFLVEVAPGTFSENFPIDVNDIPPGSAVRYRVIAQDASVAKNEVTSPSAGMHEFPIVTQGTLAKLNFEAPGGEEVEGVWERGVPSGVEPHSGQAVWGTVLSGSYPADAQVSSLTLPEFRNLDLLPQAYLVFWHWHELEHEGTIEPGRPPAGKVYDGANIKTSSDFAQWTLASPQGGYTGIIEFSQWNPLSQEPAFGGHSFGWRREIVPLPQASSVRVRFDLGTDNNNTAGTSFRGWFLDDVSVVTSIPPDTEPPVVHELPDAFQTRAVGVSLPAVEMRVGDDTGVSEVRAEYAVNGVAEGTFRLGSTGLEVFSGTFPSELQLSSGDQVQYVFRVTDFDGNQVVAPSPAEEPLVVEYRLERSTTVLADVKASGQWHLEGNLWEILPDGRPDARSTLLAVPLFLPVNGAALTLELTHEFVLDDGLGGNVKISADDGATWNVLEPEGSHPSVLSGSSSHPMDGEGVFSGVSDGTLAATYDLSAFAGGQVQLRLDFGATRALHEGETWRIRSLTVDVSTRDDDVETPIELALNANYPDPFSEATTVHYSVPERMVVKMELFDVLGRLVSVVAYQRDEPGMHTLTVDGSDLAAGVYFLRMEAGGQRKVERMVVVR
jgi:hypothetical protein